MGTRPSRSGMYTPVAGTDELVTVGTTTIGMSCIQYSNAKLYCALQVTCPMEKVNRQWLSSA